MKPQDTGSKGSSSQNPRIEPIPGSRKVKMHCICDFCGEPYSFIAKSKTEAARMTGGSVCGSTECRNKSWEVA